ncbi:zinc ABC transporter ATP-binding protein AztA [Actinoplanes sp. NPDC023714]|uniref:zinc ABC transporter ATP-binding protein AztA n=1 Tax=Actinoplanes sp. NPDC023714 TaxID=3154322 RepID=UPI0033D62C09
MRVGHGYAGVTVLREVSLTVAPGSVTAVTGPNGSGKSTLLHVLAGEVTPQSGRVVRDCRVAFLPQRTGEIDALPLTVRECVGIGRFRGWRWPGRADRLAVAEIMERLGITSLERRRLRELSGGQRQRVLLAQALVQPAGVYILDEPTVALDTASRARVHDLLAERVAAGAAVVLASHDEAEAALAGETVSLG